MCPAEGVPVGRDEVTDTLEISFWHSYNKELIPFHLIPLKRLIFYIITYILIGLQVLHRNIQTDEYAVFCDTRSHETAVVFTVTTSSINLVNNQQCKTYIYLASYRSDYCCLLGRFDKEYICIALPIALGQRHNWWCTGTEKASYWR